MRRFRFDLEPLLRLRRLHEEQAEISLAAAQRRRRDEIERAGRLAGQLAQWREARAAASGTHPSGAGDACGMIDMEALTASLFSEQALEAEIVRQEERVAEAEAGVRVAADRLRECRIGRETLEQLRERRLAEHRQAMAAEEQQLLDETAVLRFRRAVKGRTL